MEGSCRYCDFCSTAKMGLCGQRRIWDKAGLPPFYGRPQVGLGTGICRGRDSGRGRNSLEHKKGLITGVTKLPGLRADTRPPGLSSPGQRPM